jgi:hypothetical protein
MNDMLAQANNASFKSGSLDLDQICQAWVVTIQSRTTSIYSAFNQRLRELGYIEGQNHGVSEPEKAG